MYDNIRVSPWGSGGLDTPGNSQVVICFLRNTGTNQVQLVLEGGPYGPL